MTLLVITHSIQYSAHESSLVPKSGLAGCKWVKSFAALSYVVRTNLCICMLSYWYDHVLHSYHARVFSYLMLTSLINRSLEGKEITHLTNYDAL